MLVGSSLATYNSKERSSVGHSGGGEREATLVVSCAIDRCRNNVPCSRSDFLRQSFFVIFKSVRFSLK